MFHRNPRLVFVTNLPGHAAEELIRQAFLPFGDIKDIQLPVDPVSQEPRGFAFVEYEEDEDASEAIFNLHNSELEGSVLRVEAARAQRSKEFLNRPIWADEEYYKTYILPKT
jgi:peptidyl-prolyl isomerase E (cyclophilin E)